MTESRRGLVQTGLAQALAFARTTEPRPALSRCAIGIDVVLAAAAAAAVLAAGAPAGPLGGLSAPSRPTNRTRESMSAGPGVG